MGHGYRRQRSRLENDGDEPPFALAAILEEPTESDILAYMRDDWGNAICMDEREWSRPPGSRNGAVELEEIDRPIGYHEYPPDDTPPDPATLVDGVVDPRANIVTASTLQRTLGGESYTTSDGRVGRRGCGSGKGTGTAKPPKPGPRVRGRPFSSSPDPGEDPTDDIGIYGLSIGVREYYANRMDVAVDVLDAAARELKAGKRFVDVTQLLPKRSPSALRSAVMHVRGLSGMTVFMLRVCEGTARAALTEYALEHDGDRIRLRESVLAVAA